MVQKDPAAKRFDARLAAVYRQRDDKLQHYDQWAASYETDLVDDLDYVAHRETADIFAGRVGDRSCRVLDVACGTGLVGERLQALGYRRVDGVDFSAAMLAHARARGCYRRLWRHDFTRPAELGEPYDALICVGLFAFAQPAITDLPHVVDCVRPGGSCVITVNGDAWRELKMHDEIRRLSGEQGFILEDIVEADYIREQGIDARVLIIRRQEPSAAAVAPPAGTATNPDRTLK